MELGDIILKEAKELQEELLAHQVQLHRNPEVGFDLQQTCSYVCKQLERMGYKPEKCGKSGIVATISGPQPGRVFLLRADMDALPINEEAEGEDKSRNHNMHACGHDFHTAMLLGAARLLKKHEADICGTVKLMFQPAEELLEGARDMIQSGVLEEPVVDAAMMIHVLTGLPFETGTCIVSSAGVSAPAADYFTIEVQGKGCHGSSPNTGIDPLTAAAHILIGLQEIKARELAATEAAVLTIGSFHGGEAANVIPDKVILEGTLRAFHEDLRMYLHRRIDEITGAIAKAFRSQAQVTFGNGCPTLKNEGELSQFVEQALSKMLGPDKCCNSIEMSRMMNELSEGRSGNMSGSEDFAYVSHRVPSVMVALVAGGKKQGYIYPQHHPKVRFDKEALPTGAAVYAITALSWLSQKNSGKARDVLI